MSETTVINRRLWAISWNGDFVKVRFLWFWIARWPGAGRFGTFRRVRRVRNVTVWTGGFVRRLPTHCRRGKALRWI